MPELRFRARARAAPRSLRGWGSCYPLQHGDREVRGRRGGPTAGRSWAPAGAGFRPAVGTPQGRRSCASVVGTCTSAGTGPSSRRMPTAASWPSGWPRDHFVHAYVPPLELLRRADSRPTDEAGVPHRRGRSRQGLLQDRDAGLAGRTRDPQPRCAEMRQAQAPLGQQTGWSAGAGREEGKQLQPRQAESSNVALHMCAQPAARAARGSSVSSRSTS